MGENSGIEWTDHTFNPWVGCTKVSPACDHCYAEGWAKRSGAVTWGGPRKRTRESNWAQPLRWNLAAEKAGVRQRVFCASLADVFDNEVPPSWRADLFRLIRATPALDWLLLTKRIGNADDMIAAALSEAHLLTSREPLWPWPNVWVGVTVINQAEADRDVVKLQRLPVRGRFLSIEPMLGPIDLYRGGFNFLERLKSPSTGLIYHPIDWVIAGGESGPGARPVDPNWIRQLRDQCSAWGTPFLFKQWGEWAPPVPADDDVPLGACEGRMYRVGKKRAGRMLDARTWDELPTFGVRA